MTDDVTRGLALLADEAEPAPIDSHDVITKARARTRNRRATFATALAVIGLLAVTLSISRPSTDVASGDVRDRADRLAEQLRAADVIPSRWSPAPQGVRDFECAPLVTWYPAPGNTAPPPNNPDHCITRGSYLDATGEIALWIDVSQFLGDRGTCEWSDCDWRRLPDGTIVWRTNVPPDAEGQSRQRLNAYRRDGTSIAVMVTYPADRSTPPLTVDEILKFATVFTY